VIFGIVTIYHLDNDLQAAAKSFNAKSFNNDEILVVS
jgi:hypothetical protein